MPGPNGNVPLLGGGPPKPPEPTIHEGNQDAWAVLGALRQDNAQLAAQLAQFNIGLDPMSVIQTRLTAILEVLFPSGTVEGQAAQIAVEINFETMMGNVLAEARRSAVTAQLAAGAQVHPQLLEQMARATGQVTPDGLKKKRR